MTVKEQERRSTQESWKGQNVSLTSSQSFLLSACSVTTLTAEEEDIEEEQEIEEELEQDKDKSEMEEETEEELEEDKDK